jgi:hypothetical protein
MNPISLSGRRYFALRAAFTVCLALFSTEVLLADGNACCGPAPGTYACDVNGCAHEYPSYCAQAVLAQITSCCGLGNGTATCTQIRDCEPQTAWCVRCATGKTCGTCQTQACEPPPPPPSCGCQDDQTCCEFTCYGTWMDGMCDTGSPLLINLQSNGVFHLTSAQDGVWFDLNHRGIRQLTA